jgi:hypothetical protein
LPGTESGYQAKLEHIPVLLPELNAKSLRRRCICADHQSSGLVREFFSWPSGASLFLALVLTLGWQPYKARYCWSNIVLSIRFS